MLRQAFNSFFFAQPSFLERYPGIWDVTLSVNFPCRGQGKFAFVEFVDDVIASTALCMNGFELRGRPMMVGRPQMYTPPPDGEAPALAVQPPRPQTSARTCYVGNLVQNQAHASRVAFVNCSIMHKLVLS